MPSKTAHRATARAGKKSGKPRRTKRELTPRQKLEAAIREQMRPETKNLRVQRSLAALSQQPAIKLPPEDWDWIVQNCHYEDQ